ncbi:hypothetical protein RINTHM_14880 [Richelia intracellularis HM01]|nr:hypothetical protein RINTHM_14880 [Richelia intracellularis HM01]
MAVTTGINIKNHRLFMRFGFVAISNQSKVSASIISHTNYNC